MPAFIRPRLRIVALCLLLFAALCRPAMPAAQAVGPSNLGATYDAGQANITFRVYSSRATRIEPMAGIWS